MSTLALVSTKTSVCIPTRFRQFHFLIKFCRLKERKQGLIHPQTAFETKHIDRVALLSGRDPNNKTADDEALDRKTDESINEFLSAKKD